MPGGEPAGAVNALRRAVSRGVLLAREGLSRATSRLTTSSRGSTAAEEDAAALREHHEGQRDAFGHLLDVLDDIERQLFLAAPATEAPSLGITPLNAALRSRWQRFERQPPPLAAVGSTPPWLPRDALRAAMDVTAGWMYSTRGPLVRTTAHLLSTVTSPPR